MSIQLTDEQWANVQREGQQPVHVSAPAQQADFVLLKAEVYERFKSLIEADTATPAERRFHLQEFGRRAGWDDPEMDVYDDLDPRRKA